MEEYGKIILNQIETNSSASDADFMRSYIAVRKCFADSKILCLEEKAHNQNNLLHTGLYRCKLHSGNTVWMCSKHIDNTRAQVLTDSDNQVVVNSFEEKNTMLENIIEIENIEEREKIFDMVTDFSLND
jgi:hypothetical protein